MAYGLGEVKFITCFFYENYSSFPRSKPFTMSERSLWHLRRSQPDTLAQDSVSPVCLPQIGTLEIN